MDSKSSGCGCPSKKDVQLPQQPMAVLTSNTQTKDSKQGSSK